MSRDMKQKRKRFVDYKSSSTIGIKYTYTVVFLESISLLKKEICLWSLNTLFSKSFAYPTNDISLKEMSFDPSLVPIGSEGENG